jgi:hypothetical protein
MKGTRFSEEQVSIFKHNKPCWDVPLRFAYNHYRIST